MEMFKFNQKSSSYIKRLLLAISILNISTFLFSLTSYIESDQNILPAVKQENLQVFYQSFLDKSQPVCDGSFLDKKHYVISRHCQVKPYENGDVAKCLDSLSALKAEKDGETIHRSLIDQRFPSSQSAIERVPEANRKFVHLIFIGDSRIRGLFGDFMRFLPTYDLEYEPPMGVKLKKFHMGMNVTSRLLNLRVSFFWEPTFSNNTKNTFSSWIESSEKGAIKIILAGMTLHHIMHLQEDSTYYDTFKNGLMEIEPVLRRLAKETKVIWLKQFTVMDDPFKASIFYNHMSNLISIRRSIRNFNKLSKRILRNSGVTIWDTGDFMVEEYLRSCHIQIRNDLEFTGKAYFTCPDLVHPGYVAQFYSLQLFLNEMCYEA